MTDDKYAGLRGNKHAAKSEEQRKRGFTLHKYMPYSYVEAIRTVLGEKATQEQVQDYALQVWEDALKARFTREHNAEYLGRIENVLLQNPGRTFTYTSANVNVWLLHDNLWRGEVSGGLGGCSASSFGEVVDHLRLNSWMDQGMIELVEAFEKQSQREQGEAHE